jgi:hypothetical protein
MKEALSSSETSVLTRATRRNILEDILHSDRREHLTSSSAQFLAPIRIGTATVQPKDVPSTD